jgi:deoxyxylulose-5-phosphate synthase
VEARRAARAQGVRAAVIDARFAKPLDAELICGAAAHTGYVVTIEDHAGAGGFGSAVLELLARELPRTPVRIHGLPDRFTDHGDVNAQYRAAGIDPESVAAETLVWLSEVRPARQSRSRNGGERGGSAMPRERIAAEPRARCSPPTHCRASRGAAT